jgi:hypothetical protein
MVALHAKVLLMTDWVPIEHIAFRGGPLDGEQLKDVGAAGLTEVIDSPTDGGRESR